MKEINPRLTLHTIQQPFDKLIITAYRNALILIIKIVIIKNEPNRQTFNDKCRQFITAASPLFFCILLNELLEYIFSHQTQSLLFKVLRITAAQSHHSFSSLLVNLCLSFSRSFYSPQRIKCVHIKRQIVQFSFIVCYGRICIVVEFYYRIHKIPHHLV